MKSFSAGLAGLMLCAAAPFALAAQSAAPAPAAAPVPAAPVAPAAPTEAQRAQLEAQLAEARDRLSQAAREVGELSAKLGDQMVNRFFFVGPGARPPRAMLGLQVENEDSEAGAKVIAVSPGGAAEAAGIKVGDRITAVGGVELAGPDEGRALVERMRELQPGLKVKVTVLRDGKKQDLEVTPRDAPAIVLNTGPGPGFMPPNGGVAPLPGVRNFRLEQGGPNEFRGSARLEDGWGDSERFRGMEFATLSEKLGGYFGVKSGVLVVRGGPGGAFGLQDGDVILSIDGRAPTSATHAGRILRSYQSGEKLKMRIQRDRKAQDIDVTVPDAGRQDIRIERRIVTED